MTDVHLYSRSPDVEFCGYSNPHPSEAKIHLRIQMYGEHQMASVVLAR